MKISSTQVQSLIKDYDKNQKNADQKNVNAKEMAADIKNIDQVNDTGKAYHIAKKIINDAPEIREDRLADVQKALKTGTYSVSDEEIAEKMISRSLVDKLV